MSLLHAAKDFRGKVVIAGSGPKDRALKSQADHLDLENAIFAGQISKAEKMARLGAAGPWFLPSHLRSEACGMVLVEASMFGKPMVTCEIGTGTSFINQHLETGFVVSPEATRELAEAISTLLADDEVAERYRRNLTDVA